MKKPKLSELGHRVILQSNTTATASGGAWSSSWNTGTSYWAKVEVRSWSEVDNNGKMQQYTEWLVTIRNRSINERSYRVLHDNRYLTINAAVDPWQDGEFLVLKCQEEKGVTPST